MITLAVNTFWIRVLSNLWRKKNFTPILQHLKSSLSSLDVVKIYHENETPSPFTLGVFVKCLALHSGRFRFPLKSFFFLTGSRHVIITSTSVSLISYAYLWVLINSNGVSLLAECWAKRCSPFFSTVCSPIEQVTSCVWFVVYRE